MRLDPQDRRQALIGTALHLFASRPYGAVSVDDLARAAGMSRPLVYHYFANKFELFLAALEQAADQLVLAVRSASVREPEDWLRAGVDAYLRHVREDSSGYLTLLGHGSGTATSEQEAILDRMRERLLEAVLEAMRLAEVPELLRSVLRGWIELVAQVTRDWLRTRRPDRGALVELLRELFGATVRTAARHDPQVARSLAGGRGLRGAGIELLIAAAPS